MELTDKEEKRYEESARFHGKRILALGLVRLLERSGAERVQEEMESLLVAKTAKSFRAETEGKRLMKQIMALDSMDFRSPYDS